MIGVSNASGRSRYIASIFDWKPRRRRLSPNSSPAPSGVSKVPVWSITDTRSAGRPGTDDATRLTIERTCASPSTRPEVNLRSEEHTSELQSLMRISYAVFCLKKTITQNKTRYTTQLKQQQTITRHKNNTTQHSNNNIQY